MLAGVTISTRGFGAVEAERAYARAMELSAAAGGDPARQASVIYGLAALLEYQAKHREASDLLRRVEELSRRVETLDVSGRELQIPYHALRSCSAFHEGAFPESLEHGDAGLHLQLPGESIHTFAFLGEDVALGCREWFALSLWFLGFPDSAVDRLRSLVDLAAQAERRYAYAAALSQAARLSQMRQEPQPAREYAEEAIAVAREYRFAYHLAAGTIVLGWAVAAGGEPADGIAIIRDGLDQHHETGARMDRPYYLGLLADAQYRGGAIDDALETATGALDLIKQAGAPSSTRPNCAAFAP